MPVSGNKARIGLHDLPGAARNELLGFKEGILRLKITAPPEKGKANKELISFLSQRLDIPKTKLQIVKGQASRDKVITLEGLSQDEVMRRLSSSCGGAGTSKPPRR